MIDGGTNVPIGKVNKIFRNDRSQTVVFDVRASLGDPISRIGGIVAQPGKKILVTGGLKIARRGPLIANGVAPSQAP